MVHVALMGMQEWWPILIIVLLLFGARKLPDLARSLGSSVNEFKKGMSEGAKDDKAASQAHSSASSMPAPSMPSPSTPSANGPAGSRNDR